MVIRSVLKYSIFFLFGFLSANLIGFYFIGLETPILKDFGLNSFESNQAPHDFIKEDQIEIYKDKIVIKIENSSLSRYAPTGSMKPVLDENSNGIRISPRTSDEIYVGDIISFEQDGGLIVHRVIEKGFDENGEYFITKGDNNQINDGKVRFSQIKYKTIGIIW